MRGPADVLLDVSRLEGDDGPVMAAIAAIAEQKALNARLREENALLRRRLDQESARLGHV